VVIHGHGYALMGMRSDESLDGDDALTLGIGAASAVREADVAHAPIAVEGNGDVAQGQCLVQIRPIVADPQTQVRMLQMVVLVGPFPF
jgi:hypothetical protein